MLDYCPKQGKQNSKHKAHARRATRTRAPSATRRTPTPHGRHQPQGYTPQCRPQHAPTRTYSTILFPPVPVARLELARPTGHPLLRRACLPFHHTGKRKRGAETNTRDNHATTARPTSGTNAHKPHHRPAQPACADTLNRPTQTGPTYSPTPRAPWRKHPSATRTHPAHHQCRHTPCVTAPAAASTLVLFPLPGRRSRT